MTSDDIRKESSTTPAAAPPPSLEALPAIGKPRRPRRSIELLLVEDDPDDVMLVRRRLSGTHIELHVADRLAEAEALLDERLFDGMLLDLTLPDSSGLETLARARQLMPRGPIVVLTGVTAEAVGLWAIREGADDYLRKGTGDLKVLEKSIRFALERDFVRRQKAPTTARLYDNQTGLALRALFIDRLGVAMDHARRFGSMLTVLMVRIDDLSLVRETLGPEAAQAWRTALTRRILGVVGHSRLGLLADDLFGCILETTADGDPQARGAKAAIREAFARSISVPTDQYGVYERLPREPRFGVAHHPEDGPTIEWLLSAAERRLVRGEDTAPVA